MAVYSLQGDGGDGGSTSLEDIPHLSEDDYPPATNDRGFHAPPSPVQPADPGMHNAQHHPVDPLAATYAPPLPALAAPAATYAPTLPALAEHQANQQELAWYIIIRSECPHDESHFHQPN